MEGGGWNYVDGRRYSHNNYATTKYDSESDAETQLAQYCAMVQRSLVGIQSTPLRLQ